MWEIVVSNFWYIGCQDQVYVCMQFGYIDYLNGCYEIFEQVFEEVIWLMRICSLCDFFVIYGKQISLYGKFGDFEKMYEIYCEGNVIVSCCGILKYNFYFVEVMKNNFEEVKDY